MQHFYLILLLVCGAVQGKEYCTTDSDCSELGDDLICVKSQCDMGVCGCPSGKAAQFQASANKYACVQVRRVGEECDPKGEGDICGAPGSLCNEDGKCECGSGSPLRNGERCDIPGRRFPGETCTDVQGTECEGSSCRSSVTISGDRWYNPVNNNVPTCACLNNQKLVFSLARSSSEFPNSLYPTCVLRIVGDSCLDPDDCNGNAQCRDGKCQCLDPNPVESYDGTRCYPTAADRKGFGETCSSETDCDMQKGLICGDPCTVVLTAKCACSPFHDTQGTTCVRREVGTKCHGDYNCKGISERGVCVDGVCEIGNGGMQLTSSMAGLLTMLAVAALHNLF